jgi:hypothetical protein
MRSGVLEHFLIETRGRRAERLARGDLAAFVDCRYPRDHGGRPVPMPSTCSRTLAAVERKHGSNEGQLRGALGLRPDDIEATRDNHTD